MEKLISWNESNFKIIFILHKFYLMFWKKFEYHCNWNGLKRIPQAFNLTKNSQRVIFSVLFSNFSFLLVSSFFWRQRNYDLLPSVHSSTLSLFSCLYSYLQMKPNQSEQNRKTKMKLKDRKKNCKRHTYGILPMVEIAWDS